MTEITASVKIGDQDVASVILGQSPSSSSYNTVGEGMPFFQGKADFGLLHPIPRVWCSEGKKFANAGDILISVRAPVGDVNVATDSCAIGRGISAIRAGSRSDPWFLYFALLYAKPVLESRATGSTFASVNKAILLDLDIPFPNRSEQVEIGMFLRKLVDRIEQERAILSTIQALKNATMRSIFTPGLRGEAQKETEIGPIPESWERLPISALGKVVTGNTPPTKDRANYTAGEIPFVAPGDIEHGFKIEKTEKFITDRGLNYSRPITAGTTCFVCIGSTIGKVGYVTSAICATNQQINSILPNDRFDPLFTFYLMIFWADHVRKQASPSTVPILSKGLFEQIEIVTTTNLDEQQEIAAILNVIDRKINLHRKKRAVLDDLFKVLLHKLMTGEIRVSDLDLSAITDRPPIH
ncbi:MAG: restriction endonuclease subunit S [Gemmatimonadota bacterium]|nr:restriction endonuclease subunit S [Gemmatimonadota bacterium]